MLIAEMLLLAAITDDGRVPWGKGAFLAVGLSGALLVDLAINGQLRVEADGRVSVTGDRPDDELLAGAWDVVREQFEGRKARRIVSRLSRHIGGSQARVARRLAGTGVLSQDRSARWRAARCRLVDAAARQAILGEVRMAAVGTGAVRPETALVLALAVASQLNQVVPDRRTRAAARRRMAGAPVGSSFAPPVAETVDGLIAAVTAAATAIAASGG